MDNYFKPLQRKSLMTQELLEYTRDAVQHQYTPFGGLSMLEIDPSIVLLNPALSKIYSNYKFKSYIFRQDPYTNYLWHKDEWRGVTINQLLVSKQSYCLFGEAQHRWVNSILEIPYHSNTLYLFNNQASHTITNFDEPRFLFSIDFELRKDQLSYEDLYRFCETNKLT